MTETWQELLEVASEAAAAGGEALASHWGQLRQIRSKGRLGDLVTEADLAAEARVLAVLQQVELLVALVTQLLLVPTPLSCSPQSLME